MFFRRKVVFQEMSNLWLFHSMRHLLPNAKLNGIYTIFFLGLYLGNLTSINLDDRAWSKLTPFIPKVCHSNLVSHQTDSFRKSVSWHYRRDREVFVNFVFEWFKSFWLVHDSKFFGIQILFVIKAIIYAEFTIAQSCVVKCFLGDQLNRLLWCRCCKLKHLSAHYESLQ